MDFAMMRMRLCAAILGLVFSVTAIGAEPRPLSAEFDGVWRSGYGKDGVYVHREVVKGRGHTRIGIESAGEYTFAAKVTDVEELYDEFSFRFYAPKGVSDGVELILHIKDVDFWWYQRLLPKKAVPGEWTEYVVPLYESEETPVSYAGKKHNWTSRGHFRPFDPTVLRRMRELGLTVKVPGFRERGRDSFESKIDGNASGREFVLTDTFFHTGIRQQPKLSIINLCSPAAVPQYEKFEATFDLTRDYPNPFDPERIDVTARFVTPSGNSFDYPCFYFQNYVRERDGEYEKLTPVGAPCWKLRIAPLEMGEYSWWVTALDEDSEVSTGRMTFTATDPVSSGFVRVSEKDPLYFEFSDGVFFYPLGINLHCTYDDRFHNITMGKGMMDVRDHPEDTRESVGGFLIDRRSYFHTDIFEKLAQNGMNATEIWLASWGYEIEWRGDWRGYGGINHYNMENAWRLDVVTESAQENGIFFNLVFHCHGQFAEGGIRGEDGEFDHHPYRWSNGGFLHNPLQMFYDRRSFDFLMKRMRYVVARYGYSRNIFSWEILSETDLTAARTGRTSRNFVLRYTDRLRAMDVHNHLVTNHYSGTYNVIDHRLMRNRRMDYIAGDAYRGWHSRGSPFCFRPFHDLLKATSDYWNTFGKPGLVTECGCCWFGGPEQALYNDVHQVCWAGWMTHLGGTPMFWWVQYIDEKDLYWHYRAFAKYAEGEDKRGRGLRMTKTGINVTGSYDPELAAALLTNEHGGYGWIYDIGEYNIWTRTNREKGIYYDKRNYEAPEFKGVCVDIEGLLAGDYRVEIWDTYSGEIVADFSLSASRRSSPGMRSIIGESSRSGQKLPANHFLTVPLPPFKKDIAFKIRPAASDP